MNAFVCPECHGRKTDLSGTTLCLPCLGTGVLEDVRLSKHFTLAECVRSEVATRRAIPNMPTPEQVENLRRVCLIADLVRDEFGPVRVNSGFRSRNVNALVGGMIGQERTVLPLLADREFGLTAVMATHNPRLAEQCDRVLRLGLAARARLRILGPRGDQVREECGEREHVADCRG